MKNSSRRWGESAIKSSWVSGGKLEINSSKSPRVTAPWASRTNTKNSEDFFGTFDPHNCAQNTFSNLEICEIYNFFTLENMLCAQFSTLKCGHTTFSDLKIVHIERFGGKKSRFPDPPLIDPPLIDPPRGSGGSRGGSIRGGTSSLWRISTQSRRLPIEEKIFFLGPGD